MCAFNDPVPLSTAAACSSIDPVSASSLFFASPHAAAATPTAAPSAATAPTIARIGPPAIVIPPSAREIAAIAAFKAASVAIPDASAPSAVTTPKIAPTNTGLLWIKSVAHSNAPVPVSASSPRAGVNTSPIAAFTLAKLFSSIAILASVVSYLLLASSTSAVFSSHARFAVATAPVNVSDAKAKDLSMLDCRTPERPSSSNTRVALSPCSPSPPSPAINAWTAVMASLSQVFAKPDADIPAMRANSSRFSPPSATAFSMAVRVWVIAVPPASASMPTEDMAVAKAIICDSVSPASVPAEARRVAISVISASVVAKLLPRPTMTEPRRS